MDPFIWKLLESSEFNIYEVYPNFYQIEDLRNYEQVFQVFCFAQHYILL